MTTNWCDLWHSSLENRCQIGVSGAHLVDLLELIAQNSLIFGLICFRTKPADHQEISYKPQQGHCHGSCQISCGLYNDDNLSGVCIQVLCIWVLCKKVVSYSCECFGWINIMMMALIKCSQKLGKRMRGMRQYWVASDIGNHICWGIEHRV